MGEDCTGLGGDELEDSDGNLSGCGEQGLRRGVAIWGDAGGGCCGVVASGCGGGSFGWGCGRRRCVRGRIVVGS